MLQMVLGTICSIFLFVSIALATQAVVAMVSIIRTGQPDTGRLRPVGKRLKVLAIESLGHTRMLKWSVQGAAHWAVFVGFYGLFLTLVQAFGEVYNPHYELPLIGDWFLWNWFIDLIGALTDLNIVMLIAIRQRAPPGRHGDRPPPSRAP